MLHIKWYNIYIFLLFMSIFITPVTLILENDNPQDTIAIIGAGFAGISAFNYLKNNGIKNIMIFEASNRIGGRVFPLKYKQGYLQLGAQFINGRNNPIYEIAEKLKIIKGMEDDDGLIYTGEYKLGKCILGEEYIKKFTNFSRNLERIYEQLGGDDSMNSRTVGDMFSRDYKTFLINEKILVKKLKIKKFYDALAELYKSYYEIEWSSPIEKLSLRNLDLWDDKEDELKSYTLDEYGYKAILDYISQNITEEYISFNSRIINIDYTNAEQIVLTLSNGETIKKYSKVIITVPLGHLKKYGYSLFTPTLEEKRLKAINALGFGNMQKIFLEYSQPFWKKNTDWIHTVLIDGCGTTTGAFSKIFRSFQPLDWNNENILVGWISGKGPTLIKDISDKVLMEKITEHLRSTFDNSSIPMPTNIIRKSWIDDDLFLGSYTYHTPESATMNEDPIKTISKPIYKNGEPIIMFAGEATHTSIYQTVIGAYLSGEREANRILKCNGFN